MGFVTELKPIFEFTYKTEFENGLTEFEYDHVFTGIYDEGFDPNKEEVKDYCFKSLEEIASSLQMHSQKYSAWFLIAFPKVHAWAKKHFVEQEVVV